MELFKATCKWSVYPIETVLLVFDENAMIFNNMSTDSPTKNMDLFFPSILPVILYYGLIVFGQIRFGIKLEYQVFYVSIWYSTLN